jgi:adenosylcobinamide-GDP ribazoletransferase
VIGSARTAIAFMTRLPVGRDDPLTVERLSRAAAWFPATGLVVGGVMAATHALAAQLTTSTAATVLALAAAIVVTGGLHEDGLADSADALGAHTTRERRLEILRDPRIGTYGALALILAVGFAIATLAPLGQGAFTRTVVIAHVLARWSTLPQALVLAAARPDGCGSLVRPSGWATAAGTVTAVAVCLTVGGLGPGAAAFAMAAAVTAAGGYGAQRTLAGVTGDTLGAVNKLVELSAYVTLAALSSR